MENQIVLLDTSILIDYYRKKDKTNSALYKLSDRYKSFAVSVVTHYEIFIGAQPAQIAFWDEFFTKLTILPFDIETSTKAVEISNDLKKKNKKIDLPDLFIAATALSHNLLCSTLNRKHFERIDDLKVIDI